MCENDFLPKVVCSQCLRSLEECYVFRKECVSSESMLSSYFKNFRYTEDFKKSGKVSYDVFGCGERHASVSSILELQARK